MSSRKHERRESIRHPDQSYAADFGRGAAQPADTPVPNAAGPGPQGESPESKGA